jgi:hypothetical protein
VLEASSSSRFQEDNEDAPATHRHGRFRAEVVVVRRKAKVPQVQDRESSGSLVKSAMPSRGHRHAYPVAGDQYGTTTVLSSGWRSQKWEHSCREETFHPPNVTCESTGSVPELCEGAVCRPTRQVQRQSSRPALSNRSRVRSSSMATPRSCRRGSALARDAPARR